MRVACFHNSVLSSSVREWQRQNKNSTLMALRITHAMFGRYTLATPLCNISAETVYKRKAEQRLSCISLYRGPMLRKELHKQQITLICPSMSASLKGMLIHRIYGLTVTYSSLCWPNSFRTGISLTVIPNLKMQLLHRPIFFCKLISIWQLP